MIDIYLDVEAINAYCKKYGYLLEDMPPIDFSVYQINKSDNDENENLN